MKIITAAACSAILLCSAAQAQSADPLAPTGSWSAYTAGRAATPPMGWNSWNAFASAVDEEKVMGSANASSTAALRARAIVTSISTTAGRHKRRLSDGASDYPRRQISLGGLAKKTPSFKPYTDKLHAMGLKAGIYSDMGRNTCAQAWSATDEDLPKGSVAEREVGLHDHIEQDIELYFREWGFDYLKVDGCGLRDFGPNSAKVKPARPAS